MTADRTIHIALSIWDPKGSYSRHAGAAIVSVMKHTRSPVCFHILHDETLSDENRGKLISTAEKFGGQIEFFDVRGEMQRMKESSLDIEKITGRFSPGSLFRLAIPQLELDKVIYLDCDVIANLDLRELYDINIDDFYAAVAGNEHGKIRKFSIGYMRMRLMGIDVKNYFNSGVIMFNLLKIRQDFDLVCEGMKFFERYSQYTIFPDQDFLSKLFGEKVLFVDGKFNRLWAAAETERALFHLSYEFKPWAIHYGNPAEILYWQSLAESAWGENVLNYMLEANGKKFAHFHTRDCLSKISSRLAGDIFRLPMTLFGWLCRTPR